MRRPDRLAAGLLIAWLGLAPVAALGDEANRQRVARLRHLVRGTLANAETRGTPAIAETRGAPGPAAGMARRSSIARRCSTRSASDPSRLRTRAAIRDAALRFAVPSRLIEAVIRHESNGNPRAVSHAGAEGLMQLMPATARSLGVVCAFDPRENILGGTRYLRQLHDRFGNWSDALAAYNAGPSRVESGALPGETRRYVARVLQSWHPYRIGNGSTRSSPRGGG